jgi:hypothetical protein
MDNTNTTPAPAPATAEQAKKPVILTLPPQKLSVFVKVQDGKPSLNGDFRAVPLNPHGATRAYFLGVDVTDKAAEQIDNLSEKAIDSKGAPYLACGLVTAKVEVLSPRYPQEGDTTPEVSYRVKVLSLERAVDAASNRFASKLGLV